MKYILLFCLVLSFSSCQKNNALGGKNNPIKLYFTPSVDAQTISSNSMDLIKFLEQETGLYFKSAVPTSYIAVVEALGSERADIAVINSFGYLLAHEKYGALAKLTTVRHGNKYYQGQIIASEKSGIKKLEDITGKSFAFTDASSTSGYLFPLKILKEKNVNPKNTVFAIKHDSVVTMVYQGQVDAGATYYSEPAEDGTIRDARARVKTQFPDIEQKVKIIALTEKIPNDPFVFRRGFPQDIEDKFIKALTKFLSTEDGKTVFQNIYSVSGVVPASDEDYNGLRDMIKSLNVDASKLLEK